MLIIFEGVDGSGKTFTIKQIKKKLSKKHLLSFVFLKEPLTLEINGQNFTEYILNSKLDTLSEFYFFMGMRTLGYHKYLLQALKKDKIVIFDRYYYSSIVYQSISLNNQKLSTNFIENTITNSVKQLNTTEKIKNTILYPDIIFIFVSNYKDGVFRKHIQNEVNKFEKRGEEFYNKLNKNYIRLFQKLREKNKSKIYFIDSKQKIDKIIDYCCEIIMNASLKVLNKSGSK